MSLNQLIHDCKHGNTKAQSELYTLFSRKLYSICLKYSRNCTEAEDNLQDAFLAIFKKIGQYKGNGSFEGWLKRITVNTVLQCYRKQKVFEIVKEDAIPDDEIDIDTSVVSLEYLLSLIQELPDRYRLVFNLYVLDGYSHQEIAELLHITVGTSKSNLSRARQLLKEKITKNELSIMPQSLYHER